MNGETEILLPPKTEDFILKLLPSHRIVEPC